MHKKIHFIHNKNGDFMKIETIMTKSIITASIQDDVKTLSSLMKKYDIGFLPLRKGNKIVGVITDRDIALACANQIDASSKMTSYMAKEIITVSPSDSVSSALSKMGHHKIKRLLVVDHQKVVGILSLSDILSHQKEGVLNTLQKIWEINRNKHTFSTEIDEFYL